MSHIDEGLLHAYLDGAFAPGDAQVDEIEAHVASCADCGVRLEDARALKERALEVLRHATPIDVRVPPFEALSLRKHSAPDPGAVARTAATEPAAARRLARSPARLAWAASLVLAVGAGWMANELVRRNAGESTVMQDAATPVAARNAAPSDAQAVSEDAPRGDGDARASRQEDAGGGGPPSAAADAREAEAREADARESVARTQEGAAPSAQVDSHRPPPVAAAKAQAPAPDETRAIVRGAESLSDREVNLRTNDVRLDALVIDTTDTLRADTANPLYRRMRQEAGVAFDRFAPAPAAPRADAAGAEITRTAYQPGDVIVLDTMPPALSDGRVFAEHVELLNDYAAAVGGRLWSSATIEHATAALGREPAKIEGRPPDTIESAVVSGRVLVSLRYAIEDGATLEIIQRPAAPPTPRLEATVLRSAALPPAGVPVKDLGESNPALRGESLVAASRPGLVLLLKGPLVHRALHAIAARIE